MLPVNTTISSSIQLQKTALPFPDLSDRKPRKLYSPQVERRANTLLLTSGICIVAGGALLAASFLMEENNNPGDKSGLSLIPLALGGFSLQTGVGLAIPGAIMKRRNHAKLRAERKALP